MIMTTAIIYFFFILCDILCDILFLSYSWKLLSENLQPLPPPWKNSLPPKNSKTASPPLLAKIEKFSGPPAERGGGEDTVALGHLDWNDPYAWYCLSTFFKKKHFF